MLQHREKIDLEATNVFFPISTALCHSRCNAIHISDINIFPALGLLVIRESLILVPEVKDKKYLTYNTLYYNGILCLNEINRCMKYV